MPGLETQASVREPSDFQGQRHRALGSIAEAEGRWDDAIREYRAGDVGACVVCALPSLAHVYDQAGNVDSAIALFSRYTDGPDRPRANNALFLSGAHKRLGELYEAKGDRQKAIAHYQAFISLWDKADADLQPMVNQARERLAKLQKSGG